MDLLVVEREAVVEPAMFVEFGAVVGGDDKERFVDQSELVELARGTVSNLASAR